MIALDFIHTANNRSAIERHTEPLPEVPAGWTRLVAADYAHLDTVAQVLVPDPEWTPAEGQSESDRPQIMQTRVLVQGVVREYEARKAAANLQASSPTYSVTEYTDAVQVALDNAAKDNPYDYDDILSACSYASVVGPYQAEGIAFSKWRSAVWSACYAAQANPPSVQPTPSEFAAKIVSDVPLVNFLRDAGIVNDSLLSRVMRILGFGK